MNAKICKKIRKNLRYFGENVKEVKLLPATEVMGTTVSRNPLVPGVPYLAWRSYELDPHCGRAIYLAEKKRYARMSAMRA